MSGPIPLDPHEQVSMDAEKIMSVSWDFEFMVKKTFKKLARTTKFHITSLGCLIATIYKTQKVVERPQREPRARASRQLTARSLRPLGSWIYIYIYML